MDINWDRRRKERWWWGKGKRASSLSTLVIFLLRNKPQVTFFRKVQVKTTSFLVHILRLKIRYLILDPDLPSSFRAGRPLSIKVSVLYFKSCRAESLRHFSTPLNTNIYKEIGCALVFYGRWPHFGTGWCMKKIHCNTWGLLPVQLKFMYNKCLNIVLMPL